jgi:hypothetical protein
MGCGFTKIFISKTVYIFVFHAFTTAAKKAVPDKQNQLLSLAGD